MEDLNTVIDGRPSLLHELRGAPPDLRAYIRDELKRLLDNPRFQDALPGYLLPDSASQTRISIVLDRLEALASI